MLLIFMRQEKKLLKCLIIIPEKGLDAFMNHDKERDLKY